MAPRRNVDEDLAEAALQLLRAKGPRAVTVEAVAARSGIAKTTIYRRYSDRRAMLAAALSGVTSPEPPPQTAATERLRWVITHAVEAVEGGIGFGGFAALLTEEDPEFTAVFRQILVDQRTALESVIEGSWAGVDAATLIDAVVGAYIAERARTGTVAEGWESRLFDMFWPVVDR